MFYNIIKISVITQNIMKSLSVLLRPSAMVFESICR